MGICAGWKLERQQEVRRGCGVGNGGDRHAVEEYLSMGMAHRLSAFGGRKGVTSSSL